MIAGRVVLKRGAKDEAEKPFWISFADLMTALMVLFLVAMSVALLAVTKTVTERERREAERHKELEKLLDQMSRQPSATRASASTGTAMSSTFGSVLDSTPVATSLPPTRRGCSARLSQRSSRSHAMSLASDGSSASWSRGLRTGAEVIC